MYLIAGLGNPGREYEHTRHNSGFDALDVLADRLGIPVIKRANKGLIGAGYLGGEKVLLLKPQTYMNRSGESIRECLDYYKLDPQQSLIVIYDDIDLEVGALRIRKSGSAGGHNGMKDIINHVGGQDFVRVRIGVGAREGNRVLADHVLSPVRPDEREKMEEGIRAAADAVEIIVSQGADKAMNQVNRKKKSPAKDGED